MSTDFNIGGYDLKEWAFIILMINLTIVMAMVVIGFIIAIQNGQEIQITGSFDLSQFTGVILAVAAVATVLVAQQLNTKATNAAVAAALAKK